MMNEHYYDPRTFTPSFNAVNDCCLVNRLGWAIQYCAHEMMYGDPDKAQEREDRTRRVISQRILLMRAIYEAVSN